ncbi:hypothetical protein AVEN_132313-1 [Araneus ventricosus]|uniref:C2H2-type domain-containing protein n=1 Tax=Araneus ventricosus TaxID=182803 RepID=A0A4Y2X810_ARAVE|nr:hypothetical protein AVEN_132313-1 [Araneus ventricosus]
MEENISENRHATAKITHSSEINPHVPIEHFGAQLNENLQDNEIFVKSFRDKGNSVNNTTERTYICNVCGLVYSSKRNLLNHLLVHSNQQNSVSEECGRTFSERRELMRHLNVHTSKKSFICDVRGKSFRDSTSSISHFWSHKKENHTRVMCAVKHSLKVVP